MENDMRYGSGLLLFELCYSNSLIRIQTDKTLARLRDRLHNSVKNKHFVKLTKKKNSAPIFSKSAHFERNFMTLKICRFREKYLLRFFF